MSNPTSFNLNPDFSLKRARSNEENLNVKKTKVYDEETIHDRTIYINQFSIKRARSDEEETNHRQPKISKLHYKDNVHDRLESIYDQEIQFAKHPFNSQKINHEDSKLICIKQNHFYNLEKLSKYSSKNVITLKEKNSLHKLLSCILKMNKDLDADQMIDILNEVSHFQFLNIADKKIENLIFELILITSEKYSSNQSYLKLSTEKLNSLYYSLLTLKNNFQHYNHVDEMGEFIETIFNFIFTCHEFTYHANYTPFVDNLIQSKQIDLDNVGKLIKYPSRTEECIKFIEDNNNDLNVEFNYNSHSFKKDTLIINVNDFNIDTDISVNKNEEIKLINLEAIQDLTEYLQEANIHHSIVISINQSLSIDKLKAFSNALKSNEIDFKIHLELPEFDKDVLKNYLSIVDHFKDHIFSFMYSNIIDDDTEVDETENAELFEFLGEYYEVDEEDTVFIEKDQLFLTNPTFTDMVINLLTVNCNQITNLNISSPTLTQLPVLNNFSELNCLILNHCELFKEFSFDSFDQFKQLSEISLKNSPMKHLPSLNLNQLKYLNLKNCENLQSLILSEKMIRSVPKLNLSGCQSLPLITKKQLYISKEIGLENQKFDGLLKKIVKLENDLLNSDELPESTKSLLQYILRFSQGNLQRLITMELLLLAETTDQKISIIQALHEIISKSLKEMIHKIDNNKHAFNQLVASQLIPVLKLLESKNTHCPHLLKWNKLKLKTSLDLLGNLYLGNEYNESYWEFASVICNSMELLLKNDKTKKTILSLFENPEQIELMLLLAPIFEKYTIDFDQLLKSKFPSLNYYETKNFINFKKETFGYRSMI